MFRRNNGYVTRTGILFLLEQWINTNYNALLWIIIIPFLFVIKCFFFSFMLYENYSFSYDFYWIQYVCFKNVLYLFKKKRKQIKKPFFFNITEFKKKNILGKLLWQQLIIKYDIQPWRFSVFKRKCIREFNIILQFQKKYQISFYHIKFE